jgi:hypothetical protein
MTPIKALEWAESHPCECRACREAEAQHQRKALTEYWQTTVGRLDPRNPKKGNP